MCQFLIAERNYYKPIKYCSWSTENMTLVSLLAVRHEHFSTEWVLLLWYYILQIIFLTCPYDFELKTFTSKYVFIHCCIILYIVCVSVYLLLSFCSLFQKFLAASSENTTAFLHWSIETLAFLETSCSCLAFAKSLFIRIYFWRN